MCESETKTTRVSPLTSNMHQAYPKRRPSDNYTLIKAIKNGRRPTLPRSLPRSTIGAGGLNFSVRNGKRCIPAAVVTLSKKRQVFCCKAPKKGV